MSERRYWALVALVFTLNLMDAIFTVLYMELAEAKELNPLMDCALTQGIAQFMILKIVMVGLSLWILCRWRNNKRVYIALLVCANIYLCVVIYHLANLWRL